MAKAKKLKQKVKQLKRRLEQQTTLTGKAEKKINHLERELDARNGVISALKSELGDGQDDYPGAAGVSPAEYTREKGLAIEQKNAWKRHKLLCERYDVHLVGGHDKDKARTMANQDLVDSHGKKAGFTTEELRDILS